MKDKQDKRESNFIIDINNLNKMGLKKAEVIDLWRQTHGHISDLCRSAGISRTTFYNWLKDDKEFALAIVDAEYELNDDMRDALITKAQEGDLGAIIFYLKKRHPDFLDRPNQINIQQNMSLEVIEDEEETKQVAV